MLYIMHVLHQSIYLCNSTWLVRCVVRISLAISQPHIHSETYLPAPMHVTNSASTFHSGYKPETNRFSAHVHLLDAPFYPTGHGTTPHIDSTTTTITGFMDRSLVITSAI